MLQIEAEILKSEVRPKTANGAPLQVDGHARIQFKISSQLAPHIFYVVRNINRNRNLGRDWLQQNGVRIYFDLGALHLGDMYAASEKERH